MLVRGRRYSASMPIRRMSVRACRRPTTCPSLRSSHLRRVALEAIRGEKTVAEIAVDHERLEVFCAGRVLQLDNFRRLRGWKGFSKMRLWRQDKGQAACARAFMDAVKQGRPASIPLDEVLEVSRVSIELQNALRA
jgi:hypothetical protein